MHCFFIFTFQSKLFSGWWFAGISGWDYRNYKKNISSKINKEIITSNNTILRKGINWKNFEKLKEYYQRDLTLKGHVHVIRDDNNVSYITNAGILEIVFPERFYKSKDLLSNLVNSKMNKVTKSQKYYPEHSPYHYIKYDETNIGKIVNYSIYDVNITSLGGKSYISSANLSKSINFD